MKKIVIVGCPNVGKSVLFHRLTGQYATVSNYPGTTVEMTRGQTCIDDIRCEVTDTPGLYMLLPITEEEKVARQILIQNKSLVVVHVIDAKNLERMLSLTLELLECGFQVILALNMMDEAERQGLEIDEALLEAELGIPVVGLVSTTGRGLERLKKEIKKAIKTSFSDYTPARVWQPIDQIESLLSQNYSSSKRFLAWLLFQEDPESQGMIADAEPEALKAIQLVVEEAKKRFPHPIEYELAVQYRRKSSFIASKAIRQKHSKKTLSEALDVWMRHPVMGLAILFLVLYFGLYQLVGVFGAGVVVNFIETKIFGEWLTPWFTYVVIQWVPWPIFQDLLAGEYGVFTLGLRYAVALILPIVTFFFIVFSMIEDSGYLPRLALLLDRVFKKIGLSGRAVIPMVLGFGCDTMATLVTRTLPTKRERVISTLLLALAIPCSAQLGVILAILAGKPKALILWMSVIGFVFLFVGYVAARVIPGSRPSFFMELPPLRLPQISNVITKTWFRVKWYFQEIFPVFLWASVFIWIGRWTGLFDRFIKLLENPVALLGLPSQAVPIFLFGFFRRDYGAAGLYDLNRQNILTTHQLVVASVALTLFLPCIAQFLINLRERGWKVGLAISVFILFFSYTVAFAMHHMLDVVRGLL